MDILRYDQIKEGCFGILQAFVGSLYSMTPLKINTMKNAAILREEGQPRTL